MSDIHSNIYAFSAVIKDIKKHKPDLTIFLGDLAYGGLYPNECFCELKNITNLIAIKGNSDMNFDNKIIEEMKTKNKMHYEVYSWIKDKLSKTVISEMNSFKSSYKITVKNNIIGFFHGSPLSVEDRIYYNDPEDDILRKFEGTDIATAFVGHTHVRMKLQLSAIEIYNPGAIGISNDLDTRAGYGIIEITKTIKYKQKNIEYDIQKYCNEITQSKMPYREVFAAQIKSGDTNKELFR